MPACFPCRKNTLPAASRAKFVTVARTRPASAWARLLAVAGTYIENGMNGGNGGGRNCYMVNDQQPRVIGYDVTYEYGGRQLTDYFQTPPNGDTIRIRINTMPSSGR